MAAAVIELAHALDLTAVAEGVENPRQLVRLKEMGCEIAQGRYFAEASPTAPPPPSW